MQTTEPKEDSHQARGLVVSIHDVSPYTRAATEKILTDLEKLGVWKTSLLVIPNYHRRGHFLKDSSFCEWIRQKVAAGHEVVAHGYFHIRERHYNEKIWDRLVAESYTAGEGEFFDLKKNEALVLVTKALEEFRQIELSPIGFIAPAWLLGHEAAQAVAEAGFQYTTRINRIEDLVRNETQFSQSLVYSVRAAWRRTTSLAWNSLLLRMLRDRPLVRMGLHPPDWQYLSIRKHALKCIACALASREAITYENWLARQRALSNS